MPGNGILPSVPGDSMVSFMCGMIELRWLKRVPAWFFFMMVMISTYLFHHGLGMGLFGT